MTTCPVCGGVLPAQRGPRARRYCSCACRAKAYRARQRQDRTHRTGPGEERELPEAYAEVPVTALADSPAVAAQRMAGAPNAGLPADGFDLEAVTHPHRRLNRAPGSDGPRGVRQNMGCR